MRMCWVPRPANSTQTFQLKQLIVRIISGPVRRSCEAGVDCVVAHVHVQLTQARQSQSTRSEGTIQCIQSNGACCMLHGPELVRKAWFLTGRKQGGTSGAAGRHLQQAGRRHSQRLRQLSRLLLPLHWRSDQTSTIAESADYITRRLSRVLVSVITQGFDIALPSTGVLTIPGLKRNPPRS